MTKQELKEMMLKDFNDPNHKCYNNLNCILMSYNRKKKIVPHIKEVTSFVDEEYNPTKKVPEPPMSLRIYCILNDIDSKEKYPKCPICGKSKLFSSIIEGFRLSCGNSFCFQKLESVNQKRHQTVINNYGSLKAGYHDTMSKTVKEKYNVDNVSQSDNIKEKKIKTSRMNWGTDYPWQSEEGKRLQKQGVKQKYNVDNISQLDDIKRKKLETSMRNWGYDNPSKSPIVLRKIIDTWIEKYNVENISQCLKIHKKKVEKTGIQHVTESGKIFIYEGNELPFLRKLINIYGEENINSQPEVFIEYYDEYLNPHVWYPDFSVETNKEKDILIEAKYLWNLYSSLQRTNLLKHKLLFGNENYEARLWIIDDSIDKDNKPIYEVFIDDAINNEESWKIKPLSHKYNSIYKVKQMLEEIDFRNVGIFDITKF